MEQRNPRLRWLVVWVLAVVWMVAVLGRLSYLQLFCYSEYLAKAQHQQQRIFEISPMRGTIYDRKGRELAVSLPMDSVFADPAEITDVEMVSRLLSRVLDAPAEDLETKIREAQDSRAPGAKAFAGNRPANHGHESARRVLPERKPARVSAAGACGVRAGLRGRG